MASVSFLVFCVFAWCLGLVTALVVPIRVTTTATTTPTSTVTTTMTTSFTTSINTTVTTTTTSTTTTTTTIKLCRICICPKTRKDGCRKDETKTLPYGKTECGSGFTMTDEFTSKDCRIVESKSLSIDDKIAIGVCLSIIFILIGYGLYKCYCKNN